mmetsp:Transcript_15217/g.32666  ORF Transcript_15217/g.32666 Transcript_15217/m.32666 type:complete len:378 (-) Transcript_15217:45-1178(-)
MVMRAHRREWEKFEVEVVAQAVDAAMKETRSVVDVKWNAADVALREWQRARIQQAVAIAKNGRSADDGGGEQKESGSAFDFGKAVDGAGGSKTSEGASASAEKKTEGGSDANSVNGAGGGAGRNNNASTSNASRKNAKKKRGKGKKNKDVPAAPTPSEPPPERENSAAAPTRTPSSNSNSGREGDQNKDGNDNSSAADTNHSQQVSAGGGSGGSCGACGRALIGTYTVALGNKYHQQCFSCSHCRKPMSHQGKSTFRSSGNRPYCDTCYAAVVAPRCAKCRMAIMDTVTTAMNKQWHKDCLTCVRCKLPLTQTFYMYADKPKELHCANCWRGERANTAGGHIGPGPPPSARIPANPFTGPPRAAPNPVMAPSSRAHF